MNFHGVLYRGGAEQKIRKYLVDNNFVDTVIQLPPDLFFGTGIATCIIVLKKNKTDNSVLFVNASEEFVRNTNQNKLSDDNIENIIKILTERTNIEYKSALIDNEQISKNDYNLSVNTYLKQKDTEEIIDIKQLNEDIKNIVSRQSNIRKALDEIILELEVENE